MKSVKLIIGLVASVSLAHTVMATEADVAMAMDAVTSVCQGNWNDSHTQFTVTNPTECYEFAMMVRNKHQERGDDDAVEAVDKFLEEVGL
jgi:hypothetical protein